jgi:hypothetical protein
VPIVRRGARDFMAAGKRSMKMAFGKWRGGDFQPLCKWDGRFGRFSTEDRVDGQKVQRDITDGFTAAFDLKNAGQGWLLFPQGAAPETRLFPVDVEDIGPTPGENWREGVRLEVKIEGEDFWRELMSTAIGLWHGLDELHTEFVELSREHPDMVPVVELDEVHAIQTSNGTIYEPSFSIIDWIGRDAVPAPRPRPQPKAVRAPAKTAKSRPAKRNDLDEEAPF